MAEEGGGSGALDERLLAEHQSRELGLRVLSQRQELSRAHAELQHLRDHRRSTEDALASTASAWAALEDEVESLYSRSFPQFPASHRTRPAERRNELSALLLSLPHKPSRASESSHSSKVLQERSSRIASTLYSVCDSIAAAESRADELDRRLRESSADSASELSSANEQLRQQVASLRAELERAESSRKAATDKESQLSERVDQLQAHIDNQAKELEDVTASLEQSQRTIVRLENQGRHPPSQMMHGVGDSQTRQHSDQDHCADGSGNDKPLGEASAMEHDANGDAGKQAYKRQRHISEKDTEEHRKRVKAEGRIRELEEKLRGRQLELDEQRRIAFNMLRESKQLEDGLSDVGLIQKSDAYKQLTQQLSDTAHDRDSLRKERNSLQQSLDEANARQSELKRRAELAEDRAKSLAEWQDRMNEVNKRINSLIEERDAAQTALENERITRSETKTTKELRTAMEHLQNDMKRAKDEAQRHKGASQELEEARKEAGDACEQLKRYQGDLEQLKTQLEERAKMDPSRIPKLESEKEELRLFVEVLQGTCEIPNKSSASAEAARRAAEQDAAALQEEVQQYRDGDDKRRLEEVERRAAAAEREAASAKEKRKEAEQKLASKEQEADHLGEEMGNVASAYEESQAQNARLLQQLSTFDEQITEAMNEQVRARQEAKRYQEERDRAKQEVSEKQKDADIANERVSSLEQKVKERDDALARTSAERSQLQARLDEANASMKDIEAMHRALRESQERAEKLSEQSKEDQSLLERERSQRRQLEADLQASEAKLDLVAAGGMEEEARWQQQQQRGHEQLEELERYKRMFICQVCNKRPREVCIARCFHLFCKQCVQSSVQSRNRKCPACSQPFSQSDVNDVYF